MKTYRPFSAGFIVIYVLTAMTIADSAYTIYAQRMGIGIAQFGGLSSFIHVITVLALIYTWMYVRTKTVLRESDMHIVFPAYVQPAKDGQRAPFLFRQGDLDFHMVDKTIPYADIVRWGFIEDLGVSRLDKSRATEKGFLPVHEVAFCTKDGKRYHMNAGYYTKKQQVKLLSDIAGHIPVRPEGKLAETV